MITNREWLNTLNDEEWIKKASDLIDRCVFCEIVDIRNCHESDSECLKRQLAWLKAQHETTADEDFAEMGFKITSESKDRIYYEDTFKREFSILCQGHNVYNQKGAMCFTDGLIDQIRTTADKKRKEVWG